MIDRSTWGETCKLLSHAFRGCVPRLAAKRCRPLYRSSMVRGVLLIDCAFGYRGTHWLPWLMNLEFWFAGIITDFGICWYYLSSTDDEMFFAIFARWTGTLYCVFLAFCYCICFDLYLLLLGGLGGTLELSWITCSTDFRAPTNWSMFAPWIVARLIIYFSLPASYEATAYWALECFYCKTLALITEDAPALESETVFTGYLVLVASVWICFGYTSLASPRFIFFRPFRLKLLFAVITG